MVAKLNKAAENDLRLYFWVQWLCGVLPLIGLLALLTVYKTGTIATQYDLLMAFTFLGSAPIFSAVGAYHRSHSYIKGLSRLLVGWSVLLATFTFIGFVTKTSESFSREVILLWSVLGYFSLACFYLLLHFLHRRHSKAMQREMRSLIIGTSDHALLLAEKLVRHRKEPMLGMVSLFPEDEAQYQGIYPIVGNVAHLQDLICGQDIRRLYIALPLEHAEQIRGLYIHLMDSNVDVVWMPDFTQLTLLNHSFSDLDGLPLIHLNESPLTSYPTAALTKAMMDRVVAALGILAVSPILIAVAIAVKLSSPGPVIFKQTRHGWNGKVIEVWKFRSMRMHNDSQVKQATKGDPRITKVGAFIRRTSLDELPQLFNVLQGTMSLVGPRPHAVAHNDYYTGKINAYMARHRIKPGITGLAQISGCRGETETLEKMEKRVELDLAYINQWSLWLDIKVLLKTPFTLLSKDIY